MIGGKCRDFVCDTQDSKQFVGFVEDALVMHVAQKAGVGRCQDLACTSNVMVQNKRAGSATTFHVGSWRQPISQRAYVMYVRSNIF